jgi:hypothetical protein
MILAGMLAGPWLLQQIRGEAQRLAEAPVGPAPGRAAAVRSTMSVQRPRAKKCLDAPAVDLAGGDEMGMMRVGEGLDSTQINGAFKPFLSYLADCQPVDGDDHSGSVTFEFTVGCDGLVKALELTDDSLYEPQMITCLQERLEFVDFPAHDLDQGMVFEYPFIFHPPQ